MCDWEQQPITVKVSVLCTEASGSFSPSREMRTRHHHQPADFAVRGNVAYPGIAPRAKIATLLQFSVARTQALCPAHGKTGWETHEHQITSRRLAPSKRALHTASRGRSRGASHDCCGRWYCLPNEIFEMRLMLSDAKPSSSLLSNLSANLQLGGESDDACADVEANEILETLVNVARAFRIGRGEG